MCIIAISCDNTPQKNTLKTVKHSVETSENYDSFKGEASYDTENKTIIFTDTSGNYELYKNNDYYSLFTILRDEKAFLGSKSITVSFKGEKVEKGTNNLQLIKMSKLISILEKEDVETPQ
ncbi:MAG: hypothetical protein COB60_08400 [Flavobacteriaceae bacterium]|nr:MAG: hypothetical protein COB60_08400 [Flavobacteriaceae bacterium]